MNSSLIDSLPHHECGLAIEHNANRNLYMTVAEFIKNDESSDCHYEWQSNEHKSRAIMSGEIWTLQWHPRTPICFNSIAAPTLAELLEFSKSICDTEKAK